MKLILFLLLITATAQGQTTATHAPYTELRALQAENKRLQSHIDSLQSKINKQLEYHYYSCEIISSLKPNGKLANRSQYHRAIRAFFERYGMVKRKFKNDKK